MESFKTKLYEERKERRKTERDKFKIEENEFSGEDKNLNFDLYELVKKEYKENFKKIIKDEIEKQMKKINNNSNGEISLLLINK